VAFSDYETALVTGASSGIGAATVRRLCREGLTVHALARDAGRLADLARETGCITHAMSVGDLNAITALAGTLAIDVLVNNAGQSRNGDILNTTAADVDGLVDINLRAVLHITRLFVPGMVARNRGHVVNISSIAAHNAFPGGNTVYHATKAGVHALCQQLRTHLFGTAVRVTELSPARVETEVFGRLLGDLAEAKRRFFDNYEALQPTDIADAIAFVVSAPARMDVTFMEVMPTMQVLGGLRFAEMKKNLLCESK
jgi:NADP-dependent 3-hydroxy acid dehydrogenase YdfG